MQTQTGGVKCKPDSPFPEDSDNGTEIALEQTSELVVLSCKSFVCLWGEALHRRKLGPAALIQLVTLRPWAQFVPSAPPDSLDMGGAQAAQALLSQLVVSGQSHCSDEMGSAFVERQ